MCVGGGGGLVTGTRMSNGGCEGIRTTNPGYEGIETGV